MIYPRDRSFLDMFKGNFLSLHGVPLECYGIQDGSIIEAVRNWWEWYRSAQISKLSLIFSYTIIAKLNALFLCLQNEVLSEIFSTVMSADKQF